MGDIGHWHNRSRGKMKKKKLNLLGYTYIVVIIQR